MQNILKPYNTVTLGLPGLSLENQATAFSTVFQKSLSKVLEHPHVFHGFVYYRCSGLEMAQWIKMLAKADNLSLIVSHGVEEETQLQQVFLCLLHIPPPPKKKITNKCNLKIKYNVCTFLSPLLSLTLPSHSHCRPPLTKGTDREG